MVVRIHLGQPKGNFGRLGVCAGLKILRTWFDSTRFHKKIALWYNGSTTGFGSVSEGSTPSGATRKQLHGVMVAYQIPVLEVVVRIHLEFIWSLWPRGLGARLWLLFTQVRILSNSQSWSVHLIGQDYRFSICPHEFDPRTDYKRFNSTVVVQLPCNEQVAGSNPA